MAPGEGPTGERPRLVVVRPFDRPTAAGLFRQPYALYDRLTGGPGGIVWTRERLIAVVREYGLDIQFMQRRDEPEPRTVLFDKNPDYWEGFTAFMRSFTGGDDGGMASE